MIVGTGDNDVLVIGITDEDVKTMDSGLTLTY